MYRREFLNKSFQSILTSSLLFGSAKSSLLAKSTKLINELNYSESGEEFWKVVKNNFSLKKGLNYFNNASLGPSPEIVIDATEKFRRTLDAFPSKYMWGGWNQDKEEVRRKAATLLGVNKEEIALNHNTTEGMNIIAKSIILKPGDEVILADHEHPSGTIPWQYWQESRGIKLIRPQLPIIPKSMDEILNIYKRAISKRTKVISMCHMVNTNGMILPVKEVSKIAHKKDILVAVDGAQTLGMIPVNLKDLGCDFYAASSHKWIHSPKGMGIFYAKLDKQKYIKPLIVAAGYKDKSIRRFENYNTRNLPELLGLGTALDFHNLLGTRKKFNRILELKQYLRNKLDMESFFRIKTPQDDNLSAGITTVEILGKDVNLVAKILDDQYKINCRPMTILSLNGLRISTSIFNLKTDIDYLVDALKKIYKTL